MSISMPIQMMTSIYQIQRLIRHFYPPVSIQSNDF